MTFEGSSTFVDILAKRILKEDNSKVSFYSRTDSAWVEQRQIDFIRKAQAQAVLLENQGVTTGTYVVIVGATPEASLLNFMASLFAGAIPTILPVRAAFDSRELITQRLHETLELVGSDSFTVIESVKGKPIIEPRPDSRSALFDVSENNLVAPRKFRARKAAAISHVQLTSGSTGAGKGVAVSHEALLANIAALKDRAQITPYDVYVTWLPLYHDMGLVSQALMTLAIGADVHFMSAFDFLAAPFEWLRAISTKKATTTASPTFGYDLLSKRVTDEQLSELDLSNWKVAYCGAEPVRADVMAAFSGRFAPAGLRSSVLTPSYGLAETTLGVTATEVNDAWRSLCVSRSSLSRLQRVDLADYSEQDATQVVGLGRPLNGLTVKLYEVGTQKLVTEDLHCGEIIVSGTSVTAGWLHPGAILESFPDDGMHTGDVGFWHEGQLFVVDRLKNIVIRNGQNYSAQVLEQTLADAAKVSPDDVVVLDLDIETGSGLTGVIEIDKKSDPALYFRSIKEEIDRFEPPLETVVFVRRGALPRTTSGKKRHIAVREGLKSGEIRALAKHEVSLIVQHESIAVDVDLNELEMDSYANLSLTDMDTRVVELVQSYIRERGLDVPVAMASRLQYDLDFDSLGLLDLAVRAEELFAVELAREAVSEVKTVRDLVRVIQAAAKHGSTGGGISNALAKLKAEVPQYFTVVDDVKPNREILVKERWMIDFASCGYLGFEEYPEVMEAVSKAQTKWGLERWSTRAVGMPRTVLDAEDRLADFIGVPDVMIFATITLLHVGVMQVLAGSDGAILIDSAAHTSMQEAAVLARGKGSTLTSFKHGDVEDLELRLQRLASKERRIIVLDGVYSMSGMKLDVLEYQELARKYDAWLYIDDAHGFGVLGERPDADNPFGHRGNGIVRHRGATYDRIFYIGGLGKAFSTPMGFISCPTPEWRSLFHSAFPVIFGHLASTAALAQAEAVLELNDRVGDERRTRITTLTTRLMEGAEALGFTVLSGDSAVINVTVGDIDSLILATNVLWDDGIKITPAMFPAVPLDEGGLRFTVTASNTEEQVDVVLQSLSRIKAKLESRTSAPRQSVGKSTASPIR